MAIQITARQKYREKLKTLDKWDDYLMENSGLPGPRGNIELGQAVGDEGSIELFQRYISYNPEVAPTNSRLEFLVFCGVLGLGRLLAEGQTEMLITLRKFASDPRWRTREAVAMALKFWGEADMPALITEMKLWSKGNRLEQRAVVAALCEPKLLVKREQAKEVLQILSELTSSLIDAPDKGSDHFITLRKTLGYGWSVAAAALPVEGLPAMERWFGSDNKDIRWIMKQNLKKKRLIRIDGQWVEKWVAMYK